MISRVRHTRAVRSLGVAAVVVSALIATGVSAARTERAALRVVDLTPVMVRGTGFRANERVRLVLRANGTHARALRASRDGSFQARFGAVYAELCTGLQLRATGASGVFAVVTRKPPPSCAALDPAP